MHIAVSNDSSSGFAGPLSPNGARETNTGTPSCQRIAKWDLLVLIKFKVRGNLRFLSHAETVNVFQRACVRAGIKIRYSQGYNPRPKLSLPLPRSVGVESDDDLLSLRLEDSASTFDAEEFKVRLSSQLPQGYELLTVTVAKAKISPQPSQVMYILAVQQKYLNQELKIRIEHLLAETSLNLERRIDTKNSNFKNVDVRPFLKSIELNDTGIAVKCKISPAGTIRVDEILKLLELDIEKLAAPVRRTAVQWKQS